MEETVFVYSAGKLIAEYSTAPLPSNPTPNWTVTDQLGSPRVITNSLGQVVSRRDFMPFGEQAPNDGSFRPIDLYPVNDSIRQKFTGYERDNESSLDFAEARMYNFQHGRFTAVDPSRKSIIPTNPQTWNRYPYCYNNPLAYIDKNGQWPSPTQHSAQESGSPTDAQRAQTAMYSRAFFLIASGEKEFKRLDMTDEKRQAAWDLAAQYRRSQ